MSESVKPWLWGRLQTILFNDNEKAVAEKRGFLQIWRGSRKLKSAAATASQPMPRIACCGGIQTGSMAGFHLCVSDTKHTMRAFVTHSCWAKLTKDHPHFRSPQSLVGGVVSPKQFWFDFEKDLVLQDESYFLLVIEEMEYFDCAGGMSFGEPCDMNEDQDVATFLQNFVLSIGNLALPPTIGCRDLITKRSQYLPPPHTGQSDKYVSDLPAARPNAGMPLFDEATRGPTQASSCKEAFHVLHHFLLLRQKIGSSSPFYRSKSTFERKSTTTMYNAPGYFRSKCEPEDWEFDVSVRVPQVHDIAPLEIIEKEQGQQTACTTQSREHLVLAEGCCYAMTSTGLELEDPSSEDSAMETAEKPIGAEKEEIVEDADDDLFTQPPKDFLGQAIVAHSFLSGPSIIITKDVLLPSSKRLKIGMPTESFGVRRNSRSHSKGNHLLESLCLKHVNQLMQWELTKGE